MGIGLGNFAGGAAKGWLASRDDIRRQQEADYLAEQRQKQRDFEAEIAAAGAAQQQAPTPAMQDPSTWAGEVQGVGATAVPAAQPDRAGLMRDIALRRGRFQDAAALSTLADAPLRRRGLELQVGAGERAAEKDRLEMLQEKMRNDTLSQYRAAQEAAAKGDFAPLKTLAGKEFNAQVPGLDDGKTLHFIGDNTVGITDANGWGSTRPLDTKTAMQMLEYGLQKRLAAISSKDWKWNQEFELKQKKDESDAAYKKRMAGYAEAEHQRKTDESRWEWGPGGYRERMVSATAGKGEGKGQVVDVTWKDDVGEVRTGKVGLERQGRRLVAYDVASGKDIPAEDPRYKALLSGVPKTAKNDPDDNPEILNIQAKIKKGEATSEDLSRLQSIRTVSAIKAQFDAAAMRDRNAAVVDLVRRLPVLAATPQAQQRFLADLDISPDEVDVARKYIRSAGRSATPRGLERATVAAGEFDPSGAYQSEWLVR